MVFTDAQIELTNSKLAARESAPLVAIKGNELLAEVGRIVAIRISATADEQVLACLADANEVDVRFGNAARECNNCWIRRAAGDVPRQRFGLF